MDNGHILGSEYHIDSLLLRLVQIGKVHGRKDEGLWLLMAVEEVAQITQASLALDGTVESLHHQTIAGLVERELHAQLLRILQVDNGEAVRNSYHHTVAIDIADGACMAEMSHLWLLTSHLLKKRYRPSELKVVLNIGIGRAHQFYGQLVQRVVIALCDLYRPPGITTLHLSLHTNLLGLLAKGLPLCVIFQLQQQPLLQERLDR